LHGLGAHARADAGEADHLQLAQRLERVDDFLLAIGVGIGDMYDQLAVALSEQRADLFEAA
jgi:hypothetical protein